MLLPVPFESQRDNASGTGYRECFSSSCAMIARFWGAIPSDDDYNRVRVRFGDSTLAAAQCATLRALGLRADFWTNGCRVDIEAQIRGGRPVAVGWLHRGPLAAPVGGHWSVVVGLAGDGLVMHDPYGEPMLISGGHLSNRSGKNVSCSWRNFLPRWEADGPRSGWYLTCSR